MFPFFIDLLGWLIFIFFFDSFACLINCFFPLLQLNFFLELIELLFSLLVEAVEPRVSGSFFGVEDKEARLINISYLLFLAHVEWFYFVAEVLYLFFEG